jgi:hypothetical protein
VFHEERNDRARAARGLQDDARYVDQMQRDVRDIAEIEKTGSNAAVAPDRFTSNLRSTARISMVWALCAVWL